MKAAIVGADECLGTRIIESFRLGEGPFVAAIVRDASQYARAARFSIDLKVADVLDVSSLARAFSGCSAAVHVMSVDHSDVGRSTTVFCRAAAQAKVDRLVYVSTADVHGLNPPAGTDEKSPLNVRHQFEHLNALTVAERHFISESRELGLTGVVLRAGLIYGPRSEFVAQVAAELEQDRVWLYNQGHGICNCVYVDNVVAAVRQGLKAKIAGGSVFLITDEEATTWREFYQAVAREFDLATNVIHYADDLPEITTADTSGGRNIPPIGEPRFVSTNLPSSSPVDDARARHYCVWKFPTTRARNDLGLQSFVPFSDGMRRTAAWWRFAHGIFSSAG